MTHTTEEVEKTEYERGKEDGIKIGYGDGYFDANIRDSSFDAGFERGYMECLKVHGITETGDERDITSKYENAQRMYTYEEVDHVRKTAYKLGYDDGYIAGSNDDYVDWYNEWDEE